MRILQYTRYVYTLEASGELIMNSSNFVRHGLLSSCLFYLQVNCFCYDQKKLFILLTGKRGMLYRRFERLLHQLRSRERRSAPKTVAQSALKAMEDARHQRHMSTVNRRRMVTSRRQSRTDTRGLQSIRRKLRERKIHRAKLEKLAAMTRRRQQRRSHQG